MSGKQIEWDVDWLSMEQEYITARKKISMRRLALKHYPGDASKKSEAERLKSFVKAVEWNAAHSNNGKWTDQRKAYWEQISTKVLQEKSEDELTLIRQMRTQERIELEKSLQISESIVNRLQMQLVAGDNPGQYLFPELNQEDLLTLLDKWSQIRERQQKMLYRSFDIGERQDIHETRTDVPAGLAEASVFEKMFGETPFDTATRANIQRAQGVPA